MVNPSMHDIFDFNYNIPTRIVFGKGILSKVGEEVKELGKKALIVITSGGSMKRYGYLDKLTKSLEEASIKWVVYDKVSTNPTAETAWEAAQLVIKEACDLVIGLGGGSPIDVAKIAAASAVTHIHPRDYTLGIERVSDALPIVAIPTTHGTGTEVNRYAVLTDTRTKAKRGIASPKIYPKIAILDPELTVTLPQRLSAATTIDALSHAIESYVKNTTNKLSMMFSEEAVRNIFTYGPLQMLAPYNLEVREKLLWASMCAGIAIDIAGTTLCHGMEHPLSALFNVHHGEGLAALLLTWAMFIRQVVKERFANLALILGNSGNDVDELSFKFIYAISQLVEKMNLKVRLRDFGIKEEHIDLLVENAWSFNKYNIDNSPKPVNKEDLRELYLKAL